MRKLIFGVVLSTLAFSGMAKENIELQKNVTKTEANSKKMKFGSDCEPASASADLDVNNVRTKILNGGDMWWDLNNPKYEIPKINDLNAVRKNSLFSGAIWIGGYEQGNLKIAAMTYRQRGSDFWPGPLDDANGATSAFFCSQYDKIYQVSRDEIISHWEEYLANGTVISPTENISKWPGDRVDRLFGMEPMAPYFDADGDNQYRPEAGDYPILQTECRGNKIAKENNKPEDQPDKMLWFVYNDKGNIHSETNGLPIGLELQTTAFAYATNDEINNMTFYKTKIINRGSATLDETYFGEWVDADLGNYADDYVGCDVGLSLGFCYNGDDNDEGILGYGLNPPSVGVDFFESPRKDTIIDGVPTTRELGMSKFVYYNNDATIKGNPGQAIDFYNYLRGRWRNGDPIKFGGDGFSGSVITNYMFPGNTDPAHANENWTERSAGNTPQDRRFLQTSGPFSLKPGAINYITVGVVWARTSSGGAEGSLTLLKAASRKAQELFDNCFDILDGPDAPTVETQELNKELVFNFKGTGKIESYNESTVIDGIKKFYRFQGYRIYQLKDGTVGTGDLTDIDKAREIFLCDIQDSITRLVNTPFDGTLGQPLPKLMVEGPNKGLVHSLSVKEDAFATGSNKDLVNNKTYYFMVLSYSGLPGHPAQEYLAGRKIRQFSIIPRIPIGTADGGYTIKSSYGDGPQIVRVEGTGNGGLAIELTDESVNDILQNNFKAKPVYQRGKGPINIRVIDPLKVPKGNFELSLIETPIPSNSRVRDNGVIDTNTRWILVRIGENGLASDTIFADTSINYKNEQILIESAGSKKIGDWGLAITVYQVDAPSVDKEDLTNGLISWDVKWPDNSKQWLTAIPDFDGAPWYDWIRSGRNGASDASKDFSENDYFIGLDAIDKFEVYEKIWDGRVAPYQLAARNIYNNSANGAPRRSPLLVQGPAFGGYSNTATYKPFTSTYYGLQNLPGIDLVITPDKTKWTQCVVIELGEEPTLNEGGTNKFMIRDHNSVNLDGSENTAEKGRSWFPGYAINVETGERLNIIIGEDSYQITENGRDMKWNPTSRTSQYTSTYPSFGGRHYIYIMGSQEGYISPTNPNKIFDAGPKYDNGNYYKGLYDGILTATDAVKSTTIQDKIMSQCMWVVPTYLAPGFKMETVDGMPSPITQFDMKIRVKRPYKYFSTGVSTNNDNPKYSFTTNDIYTEITKKAGEDLMEKINIVPNPYYAFSAYENNPIENKVKFTNLPYKCEISIYTLDGQLVKRIKKDDDATAITWDLKNQARVPIASGMYLIHVDGGEFGEKVLKWMGIMRELDLDSF
jgi:hypothetical protein